MPFIKSYQISVVIPTHNRCASLERTLFTLKDQSISTSKLEVIIVADGCTDGTVSMLKKFDADFTFHVIEQHGQGAATARNHGARIANGRIILFLDDDISACPDLLTSHLFAHEQAQKQVVIGACLPVTKGKTNYLRINMRSWWFRQYSKMAKPSHRFTYRDFMTGNISIEKSEFIKINGFDESFRFIETFKGACSCEDWEFGVRAIKNRMQFCYCPEAYGYHFESESTDIKRFFIRATQEGRGESLMGERHAEIISSLQMSAHGDTNLRKLLTLRLALLQSPFINTLVSSMTALLSILEYLRLYRLWRKTCGWARLYWYWSGVTEKYCTIECIEKFLSNKNLTSHEATEWLSINLMDDIDQIEKQIDNKRPDALIITYNELELGHIWPCPGAEKLRGIHIKKILENHLLNSAFSDLLLPLEKKTGPSPN